MKLYAYAALALALLGLIAYEVKVHKRAARVEVAERALATATAQHAADLTEVTKRITDDQASRKRLADAFDGIGKRFDGLKIPEPGKLIVTKEIPGEPCPRVAAGPEFAGVYNAAASP